MLIPQGYRDRVIGYVREAPDEQDAAAQICAIMSYANRKNLQVHEFVEIQNTLRKQQKTRLLDASLVEYMSTVIVTELCILGGSFSEVLALIHELLKKQVKIIVTKQDVVIGNDTVTSNIALTLISLLNEMKRKMVGWRTKKALATKKAQGIRIGKPQGTLQKSKFDQDLTIIKELLSNQLSVRKIAQRLGYRNYTSLNKYLNKRDLKGVIMHSIQQDKIPS